MKYSIKINQKAIVDNGFDLDVIDGAILNYIEDFSKSSKLRKTIIEGVEYFRIQYEHMIEEMPMLGIKSKQSLGRRVNKLVNCGILEKTILNGNSTYFRFGENYDLLISDTPVGNKEADTAGLKSPRAVDSKVQPAGLKSPSIKHSTNNSTNNINNTIVNSATSSKTNTQSNTKDVDVKKKTPEGWITKEFEEFWNIYPHARKSKKSDAKKFFKDQDSAEVLKEATLLRYKIEFGIEDSRYLPACERWIRDFVPSADVVVIDNLKKIMKLVAEMPVGEKRSKIVKDFSESYGKSVVDKVFKDVNSKRLQTIER